MSRRRGFRQRVSFGPKKRADRASGGIHNTNLFSEQQRDAGLEAKQKTEKTKELVGGGNRKKGIPRP